MARAALLLLFSLAAGPAAAHGVAGGDAEWMAGASGLAVGPWLYLGAKHMVTGYDHLLFLAGVVFFLYRLRDVALYVTMFSIGHSLTLLFGVLGGLHLSPYLVDAVVGLSVVWKALDNLGAFRGLRHYDTRAAVLGFGLVHGFGLATKLQDVALSGDGLIGNILSFNLGVEIGQLIALSLILAAITLWRASPRFAGQAVAANVVLMALGFGLCFFQLGGYFIERAAA
ncbi:HupE/UreJ family protein [Rhodobacterales bacterium HKCCE2091]|nr:HupE/UreJ family protein [Rhodobacterales bacterium HKCCE2091]